MVMMPYLYGVNKLDLAMEEAWNDTKGYWTHQDVKSLKTHTKNHGQTRMIEFKTKSSMHFYAFSFGEKYRIILQALPDTNDIYILVKVKYSIFAGRGFIWKVPQKFIDDFMEGLGLNQFKLKAKEPYKYQKIQEAVQTSPLQKEPECPVCHMKMSRTTQFCPNCGHKFE